MASIFDKLFGKTGRSGGVPSSPGSPGSPAELGGIGGLPSIPSILDGPFTPSGPATMPSLGFGGTLLAGRGAREALLNRSGRASTILTGKKRRRTGEGGTPNFDSYSSTSL